MAGFLNIFLWGHLYVGVCVCVCVCVCACACVRACVCGVFMYVFAPFICCFSCIMGMDAVSLMGMAVASVHIIKTSSVRVN